jgi:hypothetical protein
MALRRDDATQAGDDRRMKFHFFSAIAAIAGSEKSAWAYGLDD